MAPPCTDQKRGSNSQVLFNLIRGHIFTSFLHLYMMTLGENKIVRIFFCEFFGPIEHLLKPLFVGIPEVQETFSEIIEKLPGRYVDGTLKASQVAERD